MNLNPLDLPGPAFLAFYAFLLLVAHFVGKWLLHFCKSADITPTRAPNLTPLETAYLAGGAERAVDAELVRLLRHDLLVIKPGGGGFAVKDPAAGPLDGLQRDLVRETMRTDGAIERLRRLRSPVLTRAQTRLAGEGLLLAAGGSEANCVRLAKGAPFVVAIAVGVMKLLVGLARHRPVAFLVMFLIASLVILGVKLFKLPLRSAKGNAALKDFERRNAALQATAKRRGNELDDSSLMLAVGLFGASVLASDELVWMREGFISRQSSGSSDSGGGSCGGGGGGGCGGCGG